MTWNTLFMKGSISNVEDVAKDINNDDNRL